MKKKSKILSGILALSAVACVSLGIAFQSDDGVTASAVSGFSVNTLGYLEWTAESGATSYEVSSAYGTFKTTETKVNVGDAIMKAVNSATADNPDAESASITFTVTPYVDGVAGTASEYTYPITSYIDYSYDTIDLSESQINTDGDLLGTGSLSKTNKTNGVIGAMYKNSILLFGFNTNSQLSTSKTQNSLIYLFGADEKVDYKGDYYVETSYSYYAWALQLSRTNINILLEGRDVSASTAQTNSYYTTIGSWTVPTYSAGLYAQSVGVFDTYNLQGEKIGETLYFQREKMDTTNLTKTFQFEREFFVNNDILADPNNDGDNADAITDADYEGCSGFGFRSPSTNYTYTIQSGKLNEEEGAPLYKATQLSLSTNGDIGVNLYVKLNGLAQENLDKLQAQLTYDNNTEIAELSATDTQGVYKISKAVAPKDIDKQITARVVLPGGPLTKEVQYSVRDYINSTAGTAQAEIANALAQYCEAVATFFDAEAEQPTLDETPVDLTAYAPTLVSSDENVVPYGMSLIVEEKTTIRFFFKVTGEMPTDFLANGEAVEAKADQTEGFYYIDLVDISAKDLDKDFEFQVGNCKVQCSALTYGLSVLGMESDSKTVNLVKALYAYNQAANEFFGE